MKVLMISCIPLLLNVIVDFFPHCFYNIMISCSFFTGLSGSWEKKEFQICFVEILKNILNQQWECANPKP